MKVLVTGAARFIGSHVCKALCEVGYDVRGVDALTDTLYESHYKVQYLADLQECASFRFFPLDITRNEVKEHVDWADAVVHEAALPGLVRSWDLFDEYVRSNLEATRVLLEALKENTRTHLVLASTSSVYGRYASGDETAPLLPVSPYGVSKLAAEQLVYAYRTNFNISATILRYFSVYGPNQRPDMAYARFCRKLLAGSELRLTGDGHQSRSNTYITDVVEATIRAVDRRLDGLTANICGADSITLNEAVEVLAEHLGVAPRVKYVRAVPGDQYRTGGDFSLASRKLDWSPQVTISRGLAEQARAALVEHSGN
jgi:nucleoside-diphosphate-sugar epimerase